MISKNTGTKHSMGRLAFFLPNLEGGGAEKVFTLLANWFSDQNYEVYIILGNAQGVWLRSLSPNVQVVNLDRLNILYTVLPLRRTLHKIRPDVVFSSLTHSNLALILATKFCGDFSGKVVVQEAQPFDRSRVLAWGVKEHLFMLVAKLLYPLADEVTVVSESVRISLGGIKSQVIANPIDFTSLKQAAAKKPDHPWFQQKETPIIISIGRLSKEKGFDVLIKAFSMASRKKNMRLILLGEGPERANLQSLIQQHNLENKVDIPGFSGNPYACLAQSDLFVLPSFGEGFSLVLAEAIACGCNVVITNCGNEPVNMVQGGQLGTIVPTRDSEALAEGIIYRLANPLPGNKLTTGISSYDINKMAPIYRELLFQRCPQ